MIIYLNWKISPQSRRNDQAKTQYDFGRQEDGQIRQLCWDRVENLHEDLSSTINFLGPFNDEKENECALGKISSLQKYMTHEISKRNLYLPSASVSSSGIVLRTNVNESQNWMNTKIVKTCRKRKCSNMLENKTFCFERVWKASTHERYPFILRHFHSNYGTRQGMRDLWS